MANSKEARDRADAQFHKTLKATWKSKKITTPYEAEARVVREKTSRLKLLRLAKVAEIKPEAEKSPVTPGDKRSP